MPELQSQPTLEGNQPLSGDEICDQVLGKQPGYSKGLGWGPKPKVRKTTSAVVPQRHVRSPQKKRLNYKLNLMKLWNGLKCKIEISKRWLQKWNKCKSINTRLDSGTARTTT
ncbi:zinc finger protein ZPR1-like protein [Cucumis melo var. makuwa]|uniref:Zinc finger protein ZPR1-like protein n=1 Tax=Cucumis melo var. makuwa TaxID=1194695 RepID=A0A5A7U1F0_CUCMM|nr:zinc finger protein ZPR1-like protein [Cucumis melo var. makuwa]TYJ98663.1 zinc finger protein ZPR1-like protein [Cucumis melo var. makuwa]